MQLASLQFHLLQSSFYWPRGRPMPRSRRRAHAIAGFHEGSGKQLSSRESAHAKESHGRDLVASL